MSNRTGGDGFALVAARHAMTSSEVGSENYGALPSSYRRIKRSKSLATVRPSNIRLRLQRSVPFLRRQSTTTFHGGTEGRWERHEEAVQLARAHYFGRPDYQESQETDQYRLHNVKEKEHRRFRKSVRASIVLDDNSAVEVKNFSSFSITLRNRVRKVLGKTLSKKDSLPPQQLDAQRNHFSDFDHDAGLPGGFDAYQITEDVQHESKSCPAVAESELLEELDQFPCSLNPTASRESLHSNARSRVTSWTNSSIASSVGLRSGPLEHNRLSIIKEDGGPHQPSSSAGKHIGGVEVCRQSVQPTQGVGLENTVTPAVSSQRIYSALIKRISQEDAEVEKTRIALEAINQEKDKNLLNPKPTIRAVHSDSSVTTMASEHHNWLGGSRSSSWGQDQNRTDSMTGDLQDENASKNRERIVEQESQSSFFPFSSEKSPNTPSPFKRFLHERRSRSKSRSRSRSRSHSRGHAPDVDGSSVVNHQQSNPVMDRPRFALSSASIYSRTTNGGANEQYHRPIESSEELVSSIQSGSGSTGTATILPSAHASDSQRQWNPWAVPLDQSRHGPDHNSHTREDAQIRSGEQGSEHDEMPPGDMQGSSFLDAWDPTPALETPKVHILAGGGQTHSRHLRKASTDGLSNISNKADDGSKGSGGVRKLSPANLAKMLKSRKSQKGARSRSVGKENSPTAREGSPPISTPGRLHLQFRNGTSTGRLRTKTSEGVFYARNGIHTTPRGSISTTPSGSHESPSENAKSHLVARLSRPFNMDVPPHNRPFDSMYLGKRTFGHPDMFGDRLSVAPQVTEEAGSMSNQGTGDGASGLPSGSQSGSRGGSKMFGLLGRKRMVSNFLKSRRGERSTSTGDSNVAERGQVFI